MSAGYKDLRVWQQAVKLALQLYGVTDVFPKNETYGLSAQLRRAAVSVPSNIAEGKGRQSDKEFIQFLHHARGSLYEIETQLVIARERNYFSIETASELLQECEAVGRALNGLINALQGKTRDK